jgi:hypothetical protein
MICQVVVCLPERHTKTSLKPARWRIAVPSAKITTDTPSGLIITFGSPFRLRATPSKANATADVLSLIVSIICVLIAVAAPIVGILSLSSAKATSMFRAS